SVLILCSKGLIFCGDRPTITPHIPFDTTNSEHRFNRENHAGFNYVPKLIRSIIMWNDQSGMESATYTVTSKVTYDSIIETFGIRLNNTTNNIDFSARFYRFYGS